MSIRVPVAIVVVLALALGAVAILVPGKAARPARAPAAPACRGSGCSATDVRAEVGRIAARVEALRGLRFRRVPRVRLVSPATARREGLADLGRSESAASQAADGELLELLGLLPGGSSLRQIAAGIYDEQVAGYYDPRTKRLSVVAGGGGRPASGPLAEITLAHELTHALEDQRFGLRLQGGGTDDADSARQALVEGTATEVMTLYAERYLRSADTLASALSGISQSPSTSPLPPYVESSLIFPYIAGQRYVEALRRLGGGWTLVNLALSARPPRTTEQVIHPLDWLHGVGALPVRLPAGSVLGGGWRTAATGEFGEFDTDQLLKLASPALVAGDAAAGWRAGRYVLFRRGPLPEHGCGPPCPGRDALVLRWRWQTARDEREFAAAARRYAARRRGTFGGIVVRSGGRATTMAFAPAAELARRLAASR